MMVDKSLYAGHRRQSAAVRGGVQTLVTMEERPPVRMEGGGSCDFWLG